MKFSKSLVVAAVTAAFASTAGAQVTGSLGGPIGPFLGLSAPALCTGAPNCTLGSIATISGGAVRNADLFQADQQGFTVNGGAQPDGRFLAAGPNNNGNATMTFLSNNIGNIGFLWGSPDVWNRLRVNTNAGFVDFTATGLGFPSVTGSQSVSQYVRFTVTNPSNYITSIVFSNDVNQNIDAFEATQFNILPEPSTYVMMVAGLAGLFAVSKRRKTA
jgi:hypothetical protein